MRVSRRALCLLFAILLLAAPVPPRAEAVEIVSFTAVNDTLLPLAEETMPFFSGGSLYVASMAFDGTDLGIYYSRSRDKGTAVLYKQRSVIVFDLATGTVETNNGQTYSGAAITRGDVVFLPVDVLCRFFELDYSYTRISYGYLLRIKSDTVVLTDAKFIDAANATMSSRYARFERSRSETEEPAAPEEPTTPATPTTPTTPPTAQTPPQETAQRTVYFVVECTDPAKTDAMLARFDGGRITCLFAPDALSGADELLRRLACGGGTAALRIDALGGAESALEQIEAGNRALWEASNSKTRLVWLDGATEETARRVAAAGYCPISATLNLGGSNASASRMSARILAAADARKGRACVFLGTDAEIAGNLTSLLSGLRTGNCTSARLNEVTASQK